MYEEEFTMGPAEVLRLNYTTDGAFTILIEIPASALNSTSTKQFLEVEANVLNPMILEEPIKMLMNKGNRFPEMHTHDFEGADAWTGSKIIVAPIEGRDTI
jgi:hypothetical protein